MNIKLVAEHHLCVDLIGPAPVVVDVGANLGSFSRAMAGTFAGTVYAIDASPTIFKQLKSDSGIQKFNLAMTGESGVVRFNLSSNSEASSIFKLDGWDYTETVEVSAITLEDFIQQIGVKKISVLKLDIEGAELEVLAKAPPEILRMCDQISVEFHEWMGVGTVDEVKAVIKRVCECGFFHLSLVRGKYADVLFVNRRRMSKLQYGWTLVAIWVPRIWRFLFRILAASR